MNFLRTLTRPWHWLWRRSPDLAMALVIIIVLVAAGISLGWNNNRVMPRTLPGDNFFQYTSEPHNPLSFMSNWDGPDYIMIAEHGYPDMFWVNWFPLYPGAIWLVHYVVPSALDSALLVAWASLVGAVYFYIKVVRRLFNVRGTRDTVQAVSYFVLFPTGIFLIASFSESLYALVSLAAIYFALERRLAATALCLMLCTATHITGPFVVILAGLILLEEGVDWRRALGVAAAGSLGLLAYMAYLYDYFNRPLAFMESQQIYHHWTNFGFLNLITSAGPFNVVCVAAVIVATAYWWRRRRSLAVYTVLFLAILLAGRQYGGFNRYVLMAFPIQFMLFDFFRRRPQVYPYVMAALGGMWVYYWLEYAGGYIGS